MTCFYFLNLWNRKSIITWSILRERKKEYFLALQTISIINIKKKSLLYWQKKKKKKKKPIFLLLLQITSLFLFYCSREWRSTWVKFPICTLIIFIIPIEDKKKKTMFLILLYYIASNYLLNNKWVINFVLYSLSLSYSSSLIIRITRILMNFSSFFFTHSNHNLIRFFFSLPMNCEIQLNIFDDVCTQGKCVI